MDGPGNCCVFGGPPGSEEDGRTKKCFLGSPSPSGRDPGEVRSDASAPACEMGRLPLPGGPLLSSSFPSAVSVTLGQLESENSRNKQFLSFKVHGTLSRMMKSHTVPHHPAQDTDHVSGVSALQVPPTCRSLSSRLSYRTDCRGICIQVTLIYLIMPHPRAFYCGVLL